MSLDLLEWTLSAWTVVVAFGLGSVVGSFVNVLDHRLPVGASPLSPPSACPTCRTPIRWYDNIPIFSWLALRGRCRFCKVSIPARYPLVELATALLFAFTAAAWVADPSPLAGLRPGWADARLVETWPFLGLVAILFGSLVAASLIDARTFTIPLSLTWAPAALAVVVHPLHAAVVGSLGRRDEVWTIPLPAPSLLAASLGASFGLVVTWLFWARGMLPRSFADYDEWERRARAELEANPPVDAADPGVPVREALLRLGALLAPAVVLAALAGALAPTPDLTTTAAAIGAAAGLCIGLVLRSFVPTADDAAGDPIWLAYPHARREMAKETLFLTPALALGLVAFALSLPSGPLASLAADAPFWLRALGGSLLGYLAGGGLIWLIRILGTVAFGKEAMGLGDVHLMAGIGAVAGVANATLPMLIAPALGLAWFVLAALIAALRKGSTTALPFGPHLAAATMLVMLFRPVLDAALDALAGPAAAP